MPCLCCKPYMHVRQRCLSGRLVTAVCLPATKSPLLLTQEYALIFLGNIWSSPSWLTWSCFSRSSPDGHTDDARKGGPTWSPFSRPACPTFSPACPLTLTASTNPREVLGSDNGMTGQSTGHGQYLPPWTPYIASAPASPIPPSRRPHSATLNSRCQPPLIPRLTSPLRLLPLHARRSLPLVCATASHA